RGAAEGPGRGGHRAPGDAPRRRHRPGHPGASRGPPVRAVRHGAGGRDGAGARHRTARRGGAPWPGAGGFHGGTGDDLHGVLARSPTERGSRVSQQPSILVVDDEMGILDVLRILLKGEGFDVVTAQGGKAGLEARKTAAPDIVLTATNTPGV